MPTPVKTQIRKEQIRNFNESVNSVVRHPRRVSQEMTVTEATDTTVNFDYTALESYGVTMSLNGLKLNSSEFSFDEEKAIYGNTALPLVEGDILAVEYFTLDEEEE